MRAVGDALWATVMSVLCQICKQAPATVHLTDIHADGEPVERHMCESCATQEGLMTKSPDPVNVMLEKFVKMGTDMQHAAQRTCPECGISFGEFRAKGLLGCAHDYDAFRDLLLPVIERAQGGATRHVGRSPGSAGQADPCTLKLHSLRRELDRAVTEERYEDAARIRDELGALETAEDHDEPG